MYGWMGKILRVDLTAGICSEEKLDPGVAKEYIGGRGLGIYYLSHEVEAGVDPFSPRNPIIMATGPLTGTGAPTGARYMVMTKSPLTGAITCSNSGGTFPTEFKRTGYEAIIISGRSDKPVYLWLNQDTAELRAADHLWGRDTHTTTEMLLAATDAKAKVACIGPAGEKRVLFASIMNDRDRARKNFSKGYNCSECVMEALLECIDTGLPKETLKVATGFGGGVGLLGHWQPAVYGGNRYRQQRLSLANMEEGK